MISDTGKFRFGVTDLLLLVENVILLIGSCTWFSACPTGETVMSCHWAGEMVKALAILTAALSLIHILLPDSKLKTGLDIAMTGLAVLILRVPGGIINLCGNAEMTCRKVTQPWVIALGVVLIILSATDAVFYAAKASNDKHKRCDK